MGYLIAEILLFLLLAAGLGFAVGFIFGRLGRAPGAADERRVAALQEELRAARATHAEFTAELARFEAAAREARTEPEPEPEPEPIVEPKPFAEPEPEPEPTTRVMPLATAEMPAWVLEAPMGEKDDLTAIRGIGPALQTDLNDLGIYHYRQLAELGPEDLEWLAKHIGVSKDRIAREHWVDRSRKLAAAELRKAR